MTTRLRPLAVSAAVLVPLLFPPTLRSQDAAVDTVPAEALPADSLFADSLAPLDDPLLAGRDATVDESTGAWLLEFPGWHGFGIEHYNRVDGLAPSWGLRFEPVDPAARPRIEARVSAATTHAQLYWSGSVRQRLPGPGAIHAGFTLFHRSATFDAWKLSVRENDIATFVAASDMLDWWREKGWSASLEAETPDGRLAGSLQYQDASHRSLRDRSPFALFGSTYRPNPPVEEGDFRSVTATFRLDTRDIQSPLLPSPGWLVSAEGEVAGLGGDVEFERAAFDVRRFTRFGSDSWWNARAVWMGPVGGDSLPAQRHVMLGGPGSLQGFRGGSFVGSRGIQTSTEVRLPLPVGRRIALLFLSWHWVAFAEAGAVDEYDDWHADVGSGVSGLTLLAWLDLLVAQRVTDLDEERSGPRFVVRFRRDL